MSRDRSCEPDAFIRAGVMADLLIEDMKAEGFPDAFVFISTGWKTDANGVPNGALVPRGSMPAHAIRGVIQGLIQVLIKGGEDPFDGTKVYESRDGISTVMDHPQ